MTCEDRVDFLRNCTDKQRREYYDDVAKIGCILCGNHADIHHCCGHQFPAKRKHRPVIGLCYHHHQGEQGIHAGRASWVDYYGDQKELLARVEDKLNG